MGLSGWRRAGATVRAGVNRRVGIPPVAIARPSLPLYDRRDTEELGA